MKGVYNFMGIDIHMFIVKDKKVLVDVAEEVFDNFRNYEWFDNISDEGDSRAYNSFPAKYGISPQAPDDKDFDKSNTFGYYGFKYINVLSFKLWFLTYRPDKDAGWVTTYEKWQYENFRIIPEDIFHCRPKDADPNDIHFIEFINHGEPSAELFEYLKNNDIDSSADIVYWFDR